MQKNTVRKIILSLFCIFTLSNHAFINQLYCSLLGNTDVAAEYKALVHNALRNLGVNNSKSVSVKQMNNVGALIARIPVSSFTAWGIWFDQDYLDTCNANEQLFQIYHEAAHYAQKHHQKLLTFTLAVAGATGIGLYALHKHLRKNDVPHPNTITAASAATALVAFCTIVLPYIVKLQEQNADLVAAQKLIELGRSDIVQEYIQQLRELTEQESNLWWFAGNRQADYLENALRS